MSVVRPRKNYFIKPGFQSRLTAILILIVIIVANFVGALVYSFSLEKLESDLVVEYNLPIDGITLGQALLPGVIIAELISIFLVAFICIKITHAIAGPVYRMEHVARSIGEGDLTNIIKLRHKDELKDLADSMNEMTMGLRNKVISLKEGVASVKESLEVAQKQNDQTKIAEALNQLGNIEQSLQAFILEKENRTRIEDEEQESSESVEEGQGQEASETIEEKVETPAEQNNKDKEKQPENDKKD